MELLETLYCDNFDSKAIIERRCRYQGRKCPFTNWVAKTMLKYCRMALREYQRGESDWKQTKTCDCKLGAPSHPKKTA